MATAWSNWSGSVRAQPREVLRPRTERELAAAVARASKVRVVGAGHSFMPLCETDGLLVDLSEIEGEVEIAADGKTALAPAGWSLRKLTKILWDRGYSLPNQGDVNPQSLAGAISTGTHGTGAELGSLATIAQAFRLMLADGSIVECSRAVRPELFEAQRLSLGLFGIALTIRIDVLPAYRLEERISPMPLAECFERFDEIALEHRHAEFFVFPYADQVILKTLHPTDDPKPFKEHSTADDKIFKFACDLTTMIPPLAGFMQRMLMKGISTARRVGPAYQVFPSERTVKFEEMEYELPRAAGLPALREAMDWIRKERLPVAFPFEFRWAAGDDIWLSPFNIGPGASISMHQYTRMPWQELFASGERIFRSHGGRPHWAKRHTLKAAEVFQLYPRAAAFCEVRTDTDPQAKFANRHLTELFGIDAASRRERHAG